MWGGKRWNKAKENMSEEAEEEKSVRTVTDEQTDRKNERIMLLCTVNI